MWDSYKGILGLHLNARNALLERDRVCTRPQGYTEFAVTSALLMFFSKTHFTSPAIITFISLLS